MRIFINSALTLFVVLLSYKLLSNLLDVTISSVVKDFKKFFVKTLKLSSQKFEKRNKKVFETQTRTEKKKSLIYTFYRLVKDMLTDLGISGMTPEYMIILVAMISMLVSFICNLFGMSLVTDVLMFLCCFVMTFCVLYLKSKDTSRKRREAIRNAEDLICQNIEPSVLQTIKNVIPKIDPIIRFQFEKFIMNERSIFIEPALEQLNEDIGPDFDNLIGKLIKLEKEGKPGMMDSFKSNITRNSIQREYEMEEKVREDADTSEFLLCLGVVIVMFIGTFFGFPEVRAFYTSTPGQILALSCVLIILGIFCYCQKVQNTRYE